MSRTRLARGLFVVVGLGVCWMAGCAGGGASGGGTNENDGQDGGPVESPRTDGAVLVFSPDDQGAPGASAQNPAFSPDGQQIVFTLFLNGYNEGPAELWIVHVDGTDAHRVTPPEDQDNVNVPGAAWNAVRDEIVFASDRQDSDDVWSIRPDGTGLRRITEHASPPYWIEPAWSPDGEWVVFEVESEAATELDQRGVIFKVRSDGTELTQLTRREGEDYDDRLPNWSPDGDWILFQRRLPEEGTGDEWDVYVMDTDGDSVFNVSDAPEYFNTDNSWSADGLWIASSSQYPAEGGSLPRPNIIGFFVPYPDEPEEVPDPVRITFSPDHEDGAPSVSPDGQWVAFESHRSQDEESPTDIWLIQVPDDLRTPEE